MRVLPWHGHLIAEVFRAGPAVSLPVVAKRLGKTEALCEKVLRSEWGQEQLNLYHAAVRQRLVAERVRPLDELRAWGHEAARGLIATLWLATERENLREMREASVAILAHLGHGPVKRTEKKVTHAIDACTDPVKLERIINGEAVDLEELEPLGVTH